MDFEILNLEKGFNSLDLIDICKDERIMNFLFCNDNMVVNKLNED